MNGSSPRMRGTHEHNNRLHEHFRFIPAYAGNARSRPDNPIRRSVHPRVCGERDTELSGTAAINGSSPRMRGTHGNSNGIVGWPRFIPAYAGNAVRPMANCGAVPVHPRVCGERFAMNSRASSFCGSSPRMRGTHPSSREEYFLRRFIPAYAGNARRSSPPRCLSAVHPRVCGERSIMT